MKATILTLCLATFLLSSPQLCQAGVWTRKKQAFYHQLIFTYYETSTQFTRAGEITAFDNRGRFEKKELNYYLEYGISDRLTLVGNFFYDWIKYQDDFSDLTNLGFSSSEIALRYKLFERRFLFSLQSLVSIPPRCREDPLIPITNGQVDLELRLLLGRYLPQSKTYTNVEFGVRRRFEEPADELRCQLLVGSKNRKPWEFVLQYDGTVSLKNGKLTEIPQYDVIRTNEYDLHRVSGTIIYHLRGARKLTLQYYRHVAGKNTGEGWGLSGGIVYELEG